MSERSEHKIRLERLIPASREEVFRAWTQPEILRLWFGPGEFAIPSARLDVRPGGSYEIEMQPPGSTETMTLIGTFREVQPPSRLEFTWSWSRVWAEAPESLVVVDFREADGGTLVQITHGDFDDDDAASPYAIGWEGGLDKLARHFDREVAAQ
jgi:uncharacterized protein YndB with AHSA1/START domain